MPAELWRLVEYLREHGLDEVWLGIFVCMCGMRGGWILNAWLVVCWGVSMPVCACVDAGSGYGFAWLVRCVSGFYGGSVRIMFDSHLGTEAGTRTPTCTCPLGWSL